MDRNVVQAGYLIKSPPQDKLVAHWHRRFFVLWSSKIMEYYSSHERKPQDYLKSIDLNRCEDMIAPLPMPSRPHVIKLSVMNGAKLRDYYLDCSSEENMNLWVTSLAKTCGFCPVEDEDSSQQDEEEFYASADYVHERIPPLLNQLPPAHHGFQQERRSQPPPNLKPSFSQDDMLAMARACDEVDNNYHFLTENCSSTSGTMERRDSTGFTQGYYDLGVDDQTLYDMNKNPPPVWKPDFRNSCSPPPLPPSRSERNGDLDMQMKKDNLHVRQPMSPPGVFDRNRPLPPPKPQPAEVSGSATFSPRMQLPSVFSFKNDPKFTKKLEEKRQELYGEGGVVLRGRSSSMGEVGEYTQENYESIDDVKAKPMLRVNSLQYDYAGNNEEPVDYLEFESSMSDHNSRAGSLPPELPPKSDSLQREVESTVSPRHVLPVPPLPLRSNKSRSVSPNHHDVVSPSLPPTTVQKETSPPPPLPPPREVIHPPHEAALPLNINIRPRINTPPPCDEDTPPPVPIRLSSYRPGVASHIDTKAQPPSRQVAEPPQTVFPVVRHHSSPTHNHTTEHTRPPAILPQKSLPQPQKFTEVVNDIKFSPLAQRRRISAFVRQTPSPENQDNCELLSSEVYDDIQALSHLPRRNASKDDIVHSPSSPTNHISEPSTREKEFIGKYNGVLDRPPSPQIHLSPSIGQHPNQASNTTTEDPLIRSLESRLQAKRTANHPPTDNPKPSPEKRPKPKRFQPPPVRPKPGKTSAGNLSNKQPEVVNTALTSPKMTRKNVGETQPPSANPQLPDTRSTMLPGKPLIPSKPSVQDKPTVPGKPAVAEKPVKPIVANKPPSANKPVIGVKPTIPLHGNSASGKRTEGMDTLEKSRITERIVQKVDHQVTQRLQAEPPPIASRTGPSLAVPRTGPPPPAPRPTAPKTSHSSSATKNGPLYPPTATKNSPLPSETVAGQSQGATRTGLSGSGPPPVQRRTAEMKPVPGTTCEPWKKPPAIGGTSDRTVTKPPPVRPKPQVTGKPLQTSLCS